MRFISIQTLALLWALMSGFYAASQTSPIAISFTETTIKTNNTGIVEALVKLKNTSEKPIEGIFEAFSHTQDLYLVQRKPKTIVLAAKDSLFIAVKAIVSNTASSEHTSMLEASFTISGTKETKSVLLPVTIPEKRLVKMVLPELNLIYEHLGDSIRIPILILNQGNTTQNVTILAHYPEFFSANSIENTTVTVGAFSDTLIVLKKVITRAILRQEDFMISVTSLYKNGDIIAIANVRANPIKQNRRYVPEYTPDYNSVFHQMNQITATRQSGDNNVNSYDIYANAQADINKGSLYANFDINWWEQSSQIFVRNTWLGYKQKSFGMQAGNVSKFKDLNLMGRGVEAFYKTSDKSTIEAGVVDKSYSVIDYSTPSSGQSGWATFTHNGGRNKGYETSVIYDNDTNVGVQKALASSQFSVIEKPAFSLQMGNYLSRQYNSKDLMQKMGGATEVNLHGKTSRLFYNSSNYISSDYFAGMRSGALNLNERIQFSLNNYSLWAVVNHFSSAPKSLKSQVSLPSQFANTQYNLGISRRFASMSFSLTPSYITESRSEQLSSSISLQDYKMKATRINTNVNYIKNNKNINLTFEGGTFDTNFNSNKEIHFKTNLNYSWRIFSLMAFYQYNNFYLGEIIASQQQKQEKKYYNFTLSPAVQIAFFDKKLTVRAGMNYSKNISVPNMIQINSRADFNWSKNFTLFATNYYSDYSNSSNPTNTIQFGMTKRFNPLKIDNSKSDLEVYLFYDNTGNGEFDPQNTPTANQMVIINGKAFKTNNQGIIKYRKLPKGEYEIRTVNTNEWHTYTRKILVEQSVKISIGLTKTSTIKGHINYITSENAYEITKKVGGLSVIVTDEAGNVFYTRTDEAGKFILYVPKGNYTVTLEKAGISEYVNILANNLPIKATPESIIEVNFSLQVKEKRVETKKFGTKKF